MGAGVDHHADWIRVAMIFLAASGIVVPLLQRFRLGIVIGFLIAGMLVGPYGFGRLAGDYHFFEYITIRDPERIAAIGELGVIFLLFISMTALTRYLAIDLKDFDNYKILTIVTAILLLSVAALILRYTETRLVNPDEMVGSGPASDPPGTETGRQVSDAVQEKIA